ncbi:MAG: IS630 family transposase, partial [Oscillospiraceae bacterium]|nr:IS630 family transposase [Oscillospiraceae bacterium]
FLPPYSPELNPIELFWAWLKRFLRKILPSAPSFDDALSTAFHLW